jgi:hypothetical protein
MCGTELEKEMMCFRLKTLSLASILNIRVDIHPVDIAVSTWAKIIFRRFKIMSQLLHRFRMFHSAIGRRRVVQAILGTKRLDFDVILLLEDGMDLVYR